MTAVARRSDADSTAEQRDAAFAQLRVHRPVSWHWPLEEMMFHDPNDVGFWAVATHEHLVEATQRHEDFLSGPGILMESLPPEILETAQSFIAMDPPRHDQLRRIVSAAFTPKQMKRIEDRIRANARTIVDGLIEAGGQADFVRDCAALMPRYNIFDMIGVPSAEAPQLAYEAQFATGWNDPELMGEANVLERLWQAATYTHGVAKTLAGQRREDPQDDLLTALGQAEVDGQRLSDDEIAAFFTLLGIAGLDTTRQATSHAMKALTEHPEQRAWLMADFNNRIKPAVEEFVRWATPIMTFRRTVARDLELGGQPIRQNEKVVLLYSSANRDERVFTDPWRFDRPANPTPTSGSAATGSTTAWVTSLPVPSCGCCSTNCCTGCPTLRPANWNC